MAKLSKEHKDRLETAIKELETRGYKVQRINHKMPDAVAFKDGKFHAVEMVGQKWNKKRGWKNSYSKFKKELEYKHFEGAVLFFTFRHAKKDETKRLI